ncbi:MAG TPA: hypothetical protein ENN96_02410 [Candidatus Acetothermia bacterium]|nr:hypothetical protein [Candidatus Acetothermia bacterium]
MNCRSVLWIAVAVLSFLWIGMLALSPSTTTLHLVSGTVSMGVVWAWRGVIHRRRLSRVLLEGALYGAGAGWFWAA